MWKKILCLGNINSNRIRSRDDNNNVMKVVTKIITNVIEIILGKKTISSLSLWHTGKSIQLLIGSSTSKAA